MYYIIYKIIGKRVNNVFNILVFMYVKSIFLFGIKLVDIYFEVCDIC